MSDDKPSQAEGDLGDDDLTRDADAASRAPGTTGAPDGGEAPQEPDGTPVENPSGG
jgi:hypothetical protein